MNHRLPGKIRIIGGRWRSRKITFPELSELRPTADRVRETLFNWLAPFIHDKRCLDLFAGSGVLGFEALSRGAAYVTFVDRSSIVINALKKNAELLQTSTVEFILGECSEKMASLKRAPFDIVFLDPPFKQGLVAVAAQWLETQKILAEKAFIYIETEKELVPLPIPKNWKIIKNSHTTTLNYYLIERCSG